MSVVFKCQEHLRLSIDESYILGAFLTVVLAFVLVLIESRCRSCGLSDTPDGDLLRPVFDIYT